jgi:two-component system, cell cycle response regulator
MTARILVVDDIATNRRLLEAKLQAEYYEVALAASGDEALDAVGSWAPDVVLLDIMMPRMNGYEVCRALKGGPHPPKIVMITAMTSTEDELAALAAGADDYIRKPFRPEEILKAVGFPVASDGGPARAESA